MTDIIIIALRVGIILLISLVFSLLNAGKLMDASKANSYFKYYFLGSIAIPAIITSISYGTGLVLLVIFYFAILLFADHLIKKA